MPQVLKLAHLINEYGMTQVKVGRGGIETRFYSQGSVEAELFDEILLYQDFVNAAKYFL